MTQAADGLRIGIAITTYNRREMVCAQVQAIRSLTGEAYVLVVCDDGSTDGTQDALRAMGVPAICGINRGIAWNKNRGIFYLMAIHGCDVVILLDDDMRPIVQNWHARWVEAAAKLGHVNFLHPHLMPELANAECTLESPCLSPRLLGPCIAFHRYAWSMVGYMDSRFGRYGHEHTEFTNRFLRNGFGGCQRLRDGVLVNHYHVIGGGIELLPVTGNGSQADIDANTAIWHGINNESPHTFRAPWHDERQRLEFLTEIRLASRASAISLPKLDEDFAFG
jgi:glycosyltransferase involved in cell wall biosynthesis